MQSSTPNPARSLVETLGVHYAKLKRKTKGEDILRSVTVIGGRSFTVEHIGIVEIPDFIYMDGYDQDGHDYRLIQHYSQVNIVFTFVPVSELEADERRPIGFITH